MIGPILARREAAGFWLAAGLTGIGTGLGAAALTRLLERVQHTLRSGAGIDLLDAVRIRGRHLAAGPQPSE